MDQGQIAGVVDFRAAVWNTSTPTFAYLETPPNNSSFAYASRDGQQVGSINNHASLWHGVAGQHVDLHPAGYSSSEAVATDGEFQAGDAWIGGTTHAMMWNGTSESATDLHPHGAVSSEAVGVSNGLQIGTVGFSSTSGGAVYWRGTAESWHFLSAPNVMSQAHGSSENQIVGVTFFGEPIAVHGRAWLWRNLGAEQIDLQPAGPWTWSRALRTDGTYQIGLVVGPSGEHPALWKGTAESFVDLQQFVPSGYGTAAVHGVAEWNGFLYVMGRVVTNDHHVHAFILTTPVSEPGTLIICGALLCASLLKRRTTRSA